LVGGWKKRRPNPTERTVLRRALRQLEQPRPKVKHKAFDRDVHMETVEQGGKVKILLKKGSPGRAKGATNRVPRGVRASIKAIIEDVVKGNSKDVRTAFEGGLRGGPQHADRYLKLAAEYLDGKPTDNVNLNARWNQDELATAREQLGKKLSSMLSLILNRDES
jgi:hypothetical protein